MSAWSDFGASRTARQPRSLETRERSLRDRSWRPPSILPDPEPQDGYVFRWVRVSSRGSSDDINVSKRLREGWEFALAEDHPEIVFDVQAAMREDVRASGKIEIGGLVLCKLPEEMARQRRAYYQRRTDLEVEAADQAYLRDSDERMKKVVERKTRFGTSAVS